MQMDEHGEFALRNCYKRVGGYLLERRLSSTSGMNCSEAHIALHVISMQKVIVKKADKQLDTGYAQTLRNEGEILRKIGSHPTIVRLYEIIETKNSLYLILGLIEGKSLREILKERRCLSEKEAKLIITRILSAVEHVACHSVSIRLNLTLENIVIDHNGNVKLRGFLYNCLEGKAILKDEIVKEISKAAETDLPSTVISSMRLLFFSMLNGTEKEDSNKDGTFSEDCNDLFDGLLNKFRTSSDPSFASVFQNSGTNGEESLSNSSGAITESLDEEVLRYMSLTLDLNRDDIIRSVVGGKVDSLAATYRLLCVRKAKMPLREIKPAGKLLRSIRQDILSKMRLASLKKRRRELLEKSNCDLLVGKYGQKPNESSGSTLKGQGKVDTGIKSPSPSTDNVIKVVISKRLPQVQSQQSGSPGTERKSSPMKCLSLDSVNVNHLSNSEFSGVIFPSLANGDKPLTFSSSQSLTRSDRCKRLESYSPHSPTSYKYMLAQLRESRLAACVANKVDGLRISEFSPGENGTGSTLSTEGNPDTLSRLGLDAGRLQKAQLKAADIPNISDRFMRRSMAAEKVINLKMDWKLPKRRITVPVSLEDAERIRRSRANSFVRSGSASSGGGYGLSCGSPPPAPPNSALALDRQMSKTKCQRPTNAFLFVAGNNAVMKYS